MAPDSAELGLDVKVGPLVKGIETAIESFVSFGFLVNDTVAAVASGVKKTFSTAFGIISGFAAKIRDTLATAFNVFFDQIPLFMADFRTGFSAGVQGVRELEAALFAANAQVKLTGGFAGRTAQDMLDLAGSIRDVSTFSRAAAVDAQAMLTQFLNVRGDVFDAAAMSAADLASAMGGDLRSAAQSIGEALNDPIQGLDSLTRAGVRFTTQEQLMIKQLAASGRLLEAQNAIMGRLNDTVGGAAAAKAKTFGGQIDRLNNVLQDMWTNIANALVPAFEVLLPYIESSTRATSRAAEGFGQWVVEIVDWAKQSIPTIEKWYNAFIEGATKAGKWIVDKLTYAFSFIQTAIQDLPAAWDVTVKKFTYYWEEMSLTLKETWSKVTSAIENLWHGMIGRIKDAWGDMTDWTAQVIARIPGVAKALGVSQERLVASLSETQKFMKDQRTTSRTRAPEERSQAEIEHLAKLKELSEEAGEAFGDKFSKNLTANQASVNQFIDEASKRLGLNADFEAKEAERKKKERDRRGDAAKRNPYALALDGAAGSGGGFEDLTSLQRRIQTAAFKNPAVTAIDRQTAVINANHRQQMEALRAAQRSSADQANATRETTAAVRETRTPGSVD